MFWVDVQPRLPIKSILMQQTRVKSKFNLTEYRYPSPSIAASTHLTVIASVIVCRSHGLMPCCNVKLM